MRRSENYVEIVVDSNRLCTRGNCRLGDLLDKLNCIATNLVIVDDSNYRIGALRTLDVAVFVVIVFDKCDQGMAAP